MTVLDGIARGLFIGGVIQLLGDGLHAIESSLFAISVFPSKVTKQLLFYLRS